MSETMASIPPTMPQESTRQEKLAIGADGAALANQTSLTPPATDNEEFKEGGYGW